MSWKTFFALRTDEARTESGTVNLLAIIETAAAVYFHLNFALYAQSFHYVYLTPLIVPLFFLKSRKSERFSFKWFSEGVTGWVEEAITSPRRDKISVAVIVGYTVYVTVSAAIFLLAIYVDAQNMFDFACGWNGFILGAIQFSVASGFVVAVSVLLTGLGNGGVDRAGGIEVAVRGSRQKAPIVYTITAIAAVASSFVVFGWAFSLFYVMGAAAVSVLGATAALGVVNTIDAHVRRLEPGKHASGADAIKEAAIELGDRNARMKSLVGGFFYFPGMGLGFFLASFVIRFFSNAICIHHGLFEIPRNIRRLCVSTSPFQVPELVPTVSLDHDIRVVNVRDVGVAAIRIGSFSTIVFGIVWICMLPFWLIGGWFYRFYMKSTIVFLWPLLFCFSRKLIDGKVDGIRATAGKLSARVAFVIAVVYLAGIFMVPVSADVIENSSSNTPMLIISVIAKNFITVDRNWLSITSLGLAILTVSLLFFANDIVHDGKVPAWKERVEAKIAWYQGLVNIQTGFAYFNYFLIALYIMMLAYVRTHGRSLDVPIVAEALQWFYGKYAAVLLSPQP
ncbi:hypothetical protein [Rhizobium etli]|uniref:hypothetical protein n=1 Tax=Rhizobium etli TaxID=29449 RepID=UPI000383A7BA|nr:hypothetical protein [Rhizobium etli]AGS25648.1 hypothetical protein REMIM1_PE00566 [Rhizobium etli bv. mimosae str. Mim1]